MTIKHKRKTSHDGLNYTIVIAEVGINELLEELESQHVQMVV